MVSIALAFMLSTHLVAQPAVYRFYYHSILSGDCRIRRDSDSIVMVSAPGFAPKNTVTIRLNLSEPVSATVENQGTRSVTYTLRNPTRPDGAKESEAAATLFSSLQPGLLPYLLDRYSARAGGFQTLRAVDPVRGSPRDVSIELFRTEPREVRGVRVPVREWRLEAPPTAEAVIWTDESNVPLYWWVPAQNFEIVAEGFDALRPSSRFDARVSPASYAVSVDRDVLIPMRDGTRLMADIYRPTAAGRFPVILQRTCYDRSEFGIADGEFFAQRGYVYVTQHVRGRGGSEGEFRFAQYEAADGYDTVAWCAMQPWSNAQVGMIGASYNGYCAWMCAKMQPPWLKTIVPVVPVPGAPAGEPWPGGAHFTSSELSWFGLLRDRALVRPFDADITAAMNTLPIARADEVLFGHPVPAYREMLEPDRFDGRLRGASYIADLRNVDIPVLHIDGWLDTVGVSTRDNYAAMVAHGARNQKLVWGPWNHFTNRESRDGALDFTPDGYIDLRTLTLRWFDRWLKHMPNGIDREPPVSEFVLGRNRWVTANTWPPRSHSDRWYLRGGGTLSRVVPTSARPSHFIYDPSAYRYSKDKSVSYFFLRGADASGQCKRGGQLMFESAPLRKPIRIDGAIRGKLYASSSASDTDWVMTLLDVRPNGTAVDLGTGFVRARYRKSFERPRPLHPGEVYAYDIDMWQMGIVIPAGDRLRVMVGSTLFPDVDRNLNTGEPAANAVRMVTARQTVYHDARRPSYVELPIVAEG